MPIDALDRWPFRLWRPALPALLTAALLSAVAMWLMAPPSQGSSTVVIGSALSAEGEGDAFPVGVAARTLPLPDDWAESRPGSHGPVWYRVAFFAGERRGPSGSDLLAVYIARACTNLAVFVNGQLVYSGGRMAGNVTYNCNQPQLVSLPAPMVRDGVNTLDIKLVGVPATHVASRQRAGGLSVLEVGRYQELAPRHGWQTALQVGVPQGLSATMLLMGGFMFLMGWVNRRESHMAYFGALSAGWAVAEARLWWRELPFSGEVVEFLLASMMPFIALAAVQFLLRYSGRRERWVSAGLALQCALMPISLVIGGPAHLNVLARFWYTLFALQVLAASATYLRTQWHVQRRSFWLMGGLLGIVTLAVLVEFVGLRAALPPVVTVAAQTVPPMILIAVGLRLVQQHGLALKKSESDRATLEARIAQAAAEIESNFRQLSQLKVEQVTERERKRIAADLHDDLGAKLLTIVHTSESERISTLAREALEEMRLSVRGLTGRPVVLDDAIADWRAEIVSRLGQAGIESEWNIPLVELPQTLSARAYVQTTRIIRESVSNVIKHSGATRCTVTCAVTEGDFQFVIQDNGGGIPLELDGRLDRGHGMAGMKARAKQLQGQCLVESGPGYGTVIRLTIPLDRAIEPA